MPHPTYVWEHRFYRSDSHPCKRTSSCVIFAQTMQHIYVTVSAALFLHLVSFIRDRNMQGDRAWNSNFLKPSDEQMDAIKGLWTLCSTHVFLINHCWFSGFSPVEHLVDPWSSNSIVLQHQSWRCYVIQFDSIFWLVKYIHIWNIRHVCSLHNGTEHNQKILIEHYSQFMLMFWLSSISSISVGM